MPRKVTQRFAPVLLLAAGLLASGGGRAGAAAPSVGLRFLFSVSGYAPRQPFLNPQGVAYDAARGEIYVADTAHNQVVVLSKTGLPVDRFRHLVTDANGRRIPGEPAGLLSWDDGKLLMTDTLSDDIDLVDLRGLPVRTIDVTRALGRSDRASPGRMARDQAGNLYVAERSTGSVLVFDATWALVRTIGRRGKGEGRFEMVADVAVGPDGTVFVLDSIGTPAVQVFDAKGQRLSGFGNHTDKPEGFHFPVALSVDGEGRLWIADAFSHEVKAFSASGELLGAFGGIGTGPGGFFFPSDLVTTTDGLLYVVEKAGGRVQAFEIVHS